MSKEAAEKILKNNIDFVILEEDKEQILRAMLAYGDLRASQQWVSVEEMLPEQNKEVIIHLKDKSYLSTTCGMLCGDQWVDNDGEPFVIKVTHWQPKPPPPQKGEGK